MRRRMRAWGPVAAWAAVILLLTSIQLPGAVWRAAPQGTDKLAHVAVYAVLGWLAIRGLAHEGRARPAAAAAAFGAAILFAALDEAHQAWLPGREPAVADWLADVAGVTAGMLAGTLRWRRKSGHPREETADA